MNSLVINLVLVAVLAVAVMTDLRSRRIPNLLTFPALGLGLLLNSAFLGLDGLKTSGEAALLALAILLPLYMFKGLGAGDVKLMAAIGALKGPEFFIYTFAWAAIFGGGMAMLGLLRSRRVGLAFSQVDCGKRRPRGCSRSRGVTCPGSDEPGATDNNRVPQYGVGRSWRCRGHCRSHATTRCD